MPTSSDFAATLRHAARQLSRIPLKYASEPKNASSGFFSNASRMLPRNAERMIQPPRHIRATLP
ncbi:Uncharacterised protein [Vibrio cholerae]|nr:Uncharacterised protein [Vibrio cholerae]